MPPCPGLFSTTQGWPRYGCSQSQKTRATMSFAPPARKPTTNLIGRFGNFSAADAAPDSGPHPLPRNFQTVRSRDRKSTRLNSSHQIISYAVFCLKKKNNPIVAARIRALQNEARNPFSEFQFPEAVQALKQGLVRMIRAKNDRLVPALRAKLVPRL